MGGNVEAVRGGRRRGHCHHARLLSSCRRKQPPKSVPPLRRADVLEARIAERIAAREAHERAHELGLPHDHGDDDQHEDQHDHAAERARV